MIASDANNPEFAGAHNPDARLTVQFYSRPIQNNFKSEQEGRPIFDDVDCVRIFVPGDKNNVIDTIARDDHKKRFPLQWAHYTNQREGDQRLAGKTPITEWPRLTPAQVQELRALNFLAVEDVATASDQQLQKIGMVAGESPYAFRDAAKRFLSLASADAAEGAAQKRVQELERQMQDMQERLTKMAQQPPEPEQTAEPTTTRGRRKTEENAQ